MERIDKTPTITKVLKELEEFFNSNHLDPEKDYSDDSKYGSRFRALKFKLQKERDKLLKQYPYTDIKKQTQYVKAKMKKRILKAKAKAELEEAQGKKVTKKVQKLAKLEVPKDEPKAKKESKAKKEHKKRVMKYDYPLVNGREMNALEKKKYRAEQRALKEGKTPKTKKEKTSKKEEKVVEKPKKEKKVLKTKKTPKQEED